MRILNIYPVANQRWYQREFFVMILAHLVKKNLYDPTNFDVSQIIIMDNGLFEKQQVSIELQDLIDIAEQSGIPVREIIVPDAANDLDRTIELFEHNLETIKKYQDKYQFMFVSQATSYGELHKGIQYINKYTYLPLTVGISKLTPIDRAHPLAIRCYEECKFPIHFLGIKETFKELETNEVHKYIRSCDSSQLAFIAKNNDTLPANIIDYTRKGIDIDLEKDFVNENLLSQAIYNLKKERKDRGIL